MSSLTIPDEYAITSEDVANWLKISDKPTSLPDIITYTKTLLDEYIQDYCRTVPPLSVYKHVLVLYAAAVYQRQGSVNGMQQFDDYSSGATRFPLQECPPAMKILERYRRLLWA